MAFVYLALILNPNEEFETNALVDLRGNLLATFPFGWVRSGTKQGESSPCTYTGPQLAQATAAFVPRCRTSTQTGGGGFDLQCIRSIAADISY